MFATIPNFTSFLTCFDHLFRSAGKTTLIKMLVGETQPSNPEGSKLFIHHNLRVAYVSQHAFFHVEQHLEEAPAAYIQWRFKDAYDKEKINSEMYRISPEEQTRIDDFGLEAIWSRRVRAGILEYEVKKRNIKERDNKVSKTYILQCANLVRFDQLYINLLTFICLCSTTLKMNFCQWDSIAC